MTNRELYFELKKIKDHKINDSEINEILQYVNDFANFSELVSHFNDEVKNINLYHQILEKILRGIPLQYALEQAHFLDLILKVNKDVLIPRPETEQLVIKSETIIKKEFSNLGEIKIADIGVGSGAIAISMYRRILNSKVYASDISTDALAVADENINKYDAKVTLFKGDMLKPYIDNNIKLDVIISNPPYIGDEATIDSNVYDYEPHLALIAKPDYKYYEEILKNVHLVMGKKVLMIFEIGENMEDSLTNLIDKYIEYPSYEFHKDIYGKTRFLFVRYEKYDA
ncbi:MAG: peptide chain release factor N(5)-glutamine methyltransferase [Erysipelotrichaceae bacterium]|jgi:release factor glutamine methyltransferase|nr:peptide chain release factor N(5)-glutamine methyltransferase [Erysipelotrichaceae bacterium]